MEELLRRDLVYSAPSLRQQFQTAQPFKHAIVDHFFEDGFARALLETFPPPHDAQLNRFGAAGAKAVHSNLTTLDEPYRRAHAFFASAFFASWIAEATGIEGLLYDEGNFGGGTHENFDGRELRPHVDFNYHPVTRLHRRLNLIVYLNDEWDASWGGSIALHKDPRDPLNEVVEYPPSFNRCIIFETSERSWHGFEKIVLPSGQKHRSRKSLSIYLYSRERPSDEIHGEHTTFFVPRPLPSRFVAGYSLSEDDSIELGELIGQRDRLIELYQHEQHRRDEGTVEAARLRIEVADLRASRPVPVMGYVRTSNVRGMFVDGWAGGELSFNVYAERPVRGVTLRVIVPPGMPAGTSLTIALDGVVCKETVVEPGLHEITADVAVPQGASAEFRMTTSATVNPKLLILGADERDLGFFLERAVFEH